MKKIPSPQKKPWHWDSDTWAKIVVTITVLVFIFLLVDDGISEKKTKADAARRPSYKELMMPEEQHRLGLDRAFEDPDWTPPPGTKERFRKFLEEGGLEDDILDRMDEADFYDILDQFGDYDGF